MVDKIITRFVIAKKQGKRKGVLYPSPRIYLSTKLTDDSAFPFKPNDSIRVRIAGKHLVIEKAGGPPRPRKKKRKRK